MITVHRKVLLGIVLYNLGRNESCFEFTSCSAILDDGWQVLHAKREKGAAFYFIAQAEKKLNKIYRVFVLVVKHKISFSIWLSSLFTVSC